MFQNVFNIFIIVGIIFGKFPCIRSEKHKVSHLFAKLYPGVMAFLIITYYIFLLKAQFHKSISLIKLMVYSLSIFTTIMGTYIFKQEWKDLFELFQAFRTSLRTKLYDSKNISVKVAGLIIIHSIYFVASRILKYCYGNRTDIVDSVIMYTAFYPNLILLVFLVIFEEGFKEINRYWTNIAKWYRINLKIKTGKNTVFCKHMYETLYKMYILYQKATSWILVMFLLESVVSSILFTNYILGSSSLSELTLVSFIAAWGGHVQVIVSMTCFLIMLICYIVFFL